MESLFKTLEFDLVLKQLADLTLTPQGLEFVSTISPIDDIKRLKKSLAQVTELRDIIDYDHGLPLENIPDIIPHLKKAKIIGSILYPEACIEIFVCLEMARKLKNFFDLRIDKIENIFEITKDLGINGQLQKEIFRCIDTNSYEIKNEASPELSSIRKKLKQLHTKARRKMESLQQSLSAQGILQQDVIAIRNGRLVLVVKEEFKRKVKGLIHDQSSSGASLFIEPLGVLEENNQIRELGLAEEKEIEKILFHLTNLIRESISLLEKNNRIIGIIDVLNAQAQYSKVLNAFEPNIVKESVISIVDGRHPLLLRRMGKEITKPQSVTLGEKFHTLIISGPNAGGKTVALKTIGLLTLMALSGLHIPAQPHSKIGFLSHIYATIGDQQSIENDLSTFSSHLQNLKTIVVSAEKSDLVLIDEIGSGTDPEEGSALAISIIENLTERGCLTVVTTHQSTLKAFAFQNDGVENASLEFDISTLQSTFHFNVGIPGSSYAFEIAQRMGLPNGLIARAKVLVGSHKDKLEGLIVELEEKILKYKKLLNEANLRETKYRGLEKLYNEQMDNLKAETKRIKREAAEEADNMISESRAIIENTIRQIRESQANKTEIKESKRQIHEQQRKIEKTLNILAEDKVKTKESGELTQDDFVRWTKNDSSGQIVSLPDKRSMVLVQFEGGIKMRLPIAELAKIKKRKVNNVVQLNIEKEFSTKVDLRGLLSEDAQTVLDQFLDEALLAGLNEVSIIHGKGTGKLRSSVAEYLKKHPNVENFRLGNWNEGDSGVTIVNLHKQK